MHITWRYRQEIFYNHEKSQNETENIKYGCSDNNPYENIVPGQVRCAYVLSEIKNCSPPMNAGGLFYHFSETKQWISPQVGPKKYNEAW